MVTDITEELSDLELRQSQLQPQMSSLYNRQQQAVYVRKACKRYGSKSNPVIVLDSLNMTVPKGAIYGLLGASGCGKTTLLNCLVGSKKLNFGEIWVLGGTPGSRGSGVPGPRVGYMPQETALYEGFTTREIFKYFGWISGMTTQAIEQRSEFLINLFMLPDVGNAIKNLSGGQQRRVSLAVTLLHQPELLILDEPTVGLDPLLRESIWNYFTEIANQGKTTIIITTHYIEETRQAHLIGLMRGGYLLAEESPGSLLAKFSCDTLENVFLKLSVFQNVNKRNRDSVTQNNYEDTKVSSGIVNEAAVLDDIVDESDDHVSATNKERVSVAPEESIPPEMPPDQKLPRNFFDNFETVKANHMSALMWKNFLWMWRNIPFMAFLIILPTVQSILTCTAIGHDPKGLHLSIVNHELEKTEACQIIPGCNSTRLSCKYLDNLQKRTLQLNFYSTEDEAKYSVRRGEAWAALIFARNFSDAMSNRIEGRLDLPIWDIVASSVKVYQDKSNENIASLLQRHLYFGLEDFMKDYLLACDIDIRVGTVPIQWQKPVYGNNNPDFTDFMAPGIMLVIVFFLAVASTSGTLLMERHEGMLERCLVNGITKVELLISLIITQATIMVVQSLIVIICTVILKLSNNGDFVWVSLLFLLNGLMGMCYGFLIGSFCDNYNTAMYIGLGSLLPILFLCGIIWPIEAMSSILKPISYIIPLTQSTESLRSMMVRGLGISMPVVYEGFIATVIWIAILLITSILLLKFKKE